MNYLKKIFLLTVGVILSAFCFGAVEDLQDESTDLSILDQISSSLQIIEVHPKDDAYLPEYIVVRAIGD
ncbi:MAG: hypothetical protein V3575_04360, partial [Candidatus Absconditabacteria bacterium]